MKDIMFLAHRVPFPPNRGDKIRAHHLLQRLAKIARVHVGCFAESDEDRAAETELSRTATSHCIVNRSKPLALAGVEAVLAGKPVSLTAFGSNRLHAWVRETVAQRDIGTIVIFSGQMGQYVPEAFEGRVILDLCDVDSAKFASYAESGERVWINTREARLLAQEEERLGHRADALMLITENEAELYRAQLREAAGVEIHAIGNGIDTGFFDPEKVAPDQRMSDRDGPHLVFTGQMDYRPNEQAALWVIEHVMPLISKRHPGAMFHIVGRNPTAKLREAGLRSDVSITGEVPDVRPFLAAADIVLAPLLIARGVQNKVLEAMAMRSAVLLTPQAATGIEARHARDWMVCDPDSHAMAEVAHAMLCEPRLIADMGAAARAFVVAHHAWDAMLDPFEALVRGPKPEIDHVAA